MKRYGENFKLTQEPMDTIASYMDDEKRENVHFELAACKQEEFLKRYLELDFKLTQELMDTIASYMDDEKRENVHLN